MKQLLGLVVFVCVIFSNSARANEVEQINLMLGFFNKGCSINGAFTQDALDTVNKFIFVLTELAKDPDCSSAIGTVAELTSMQQGLIALNDANSPTQVQIAGLEARRQELFSAYNSEPDPFIKEAIGVRLRDTQFALAELRGVDAAETENSANFRRYQALYSLNNSTHLILDQMASNESCWSKHPAVLQNVAAFGAALANSVAMSAATGGTSSVIGAGVSLVANVMDYFERKNSERPLHQLATTLEPTALSCALEHMSRQWCTAQDAIEAMEEMAIAEDNAGSNPPVDPLADDSWRGIGLLTKEVPLVTDWLNSVMAGSQASNAAIGSRRVEMIQKQALLRSSFELASSFAKEKEKLILPDTKIEERYIIARDLAFSILSTIYLQYGSPAPGHPMTNSYDYVFAPYYLLGADDSSKFLTQSGELPALTTFTYAQWKAKGNLADDVLDPITILDRFTKWHKRVNDQFAIEYGLVLIEDPALIFAKAEAKAISGTAKGTSPQMALDTLQDFLQSHQPQASTSSSIKYLFEDTLQRLAKIKEILNKAAQGITIVNGSVLFVNRAAALLEIVDDDVAHLSTSTDFFRNRLDTLIKTIVADMLLNRTKQADDKAVRYLAANDVVENLKRISGQQDTTVIRGDALNSQTHLQGAFESFYNVFEFMFNRSLQRYDDQIVRRHEDVNGPTAYSKSVLCLNMLSATDWTEWRRYKKKGLDLGRCIGSQIRSIHPSGPRSDTFTKDYFTNTRWQKRVCSYRNFLRRSHLYEQLLKSGPATFPSQPASSASTGFLDGRVRTTLQAPLFH